MPVGCRRPTPPSDRHHLSLWHWSDFQDPNNAIRSFDLMDIVKELPARIQMQCEKVFHDDESKLYESNEKWKDFFRPNTTTLGFAEPYLGSEEQRVSFIYQYLLFGVAASGDRLKGLIEDGRVSVPIVGRYLILMLSD